MVPVSFNQGIKVDDYLGNFYMKNATDIECAGMDSLKSYIATLSLDGKLDEREDYYVQAALLYTTSSGHRRVRVHNLSLGAASQHKMVFQHASMETTTLVIARQMIQFGMNSSMTAVRTELGRKCSVILAAYRRHCTTNAPPNQLILPGSFNLFPLYTLTLLKSRAFRGGFPLFS